MSKPVRVKLWDAVNDYANACGGDTSRHVGSPARMNAVVAVERAVDAELATLRAEVKAWRKTTGYDAPDVFAANLRFADEEDPELAPLVPDPSQEQEVRHG